MVGTFVNPRPVDCPLPILHRTYDVTKIALPFPPFFITRKWQERPHKAADLAADSYGTWHLRSLCVVGGVVRLLFGLLFSQQNFEVLDFFSFWCMLVSIFIFGAFAQNQYIPLFLPHLSDMFLLRRSLAHCGVTLQLEVFRLFCFFGSVWYLIYVGPQWVIMRTPGQNSFLSGFPCNETSFDWMLFRNKDRHIPHRTSV